LQTARDWHARRTTALFTMWLEAILSRDDLRRALDQFAPVNVKLGDGGGTLFLDTPSEVELVPDEGLRVVCRAKVHWPVLGIHVPATLKEVIVLVRPIVERHDKVEMLVFKLHIERADFALVPTTVDRRLTDALNAELEKKHVELTWKFSDTLSRIIDLPPLFEPSETLALGTRGGVVKTTRESVGLAIVMRADLQRGVNKRVARNASTILPPRPTRDTSHPTDVVPPVTVAPARRSRIAERKLPVVAACAALVVLGAGMLIGRATRAH
jgi:hypothetical protein